MSKGKDHECELGAGMGLGLDPMWHQGFCAEYAIALARKHPQLRLGFSASEDMHEDWDPWGEDPPPFEAINHVFAHDNQYAYDSTGKHPLPYFHAWDADFQPVAEHNYLHYQEKDLLVILAENWQSRSEGVSSFSIDQAAVDLAEKLAPEKL